MTEQFYKSTFEAFSPSEIKEKFDRNEVILIDVRTPQEYAFAYIPGALLFPMSSFHPAKLPSQNGKPIIFYCGSGRRSCIIAEQCIHAGIHQIAHMEGGFGAWQEAGYGYVSIDPATGGYVSKP